MKKTILYLSLLSTFAIPNGVAMEEDRKTLQAKNSSLIEELENVETKAATALSLKAQRIANLKLALAHATKEKNKETTTKEALKRDLAAIEQEQAEAKQLLDDVLQQRNQCIPQEASHLLPENHIVAEIAGTSTYQQLLSQWEQGKIGPKAWAALNGENRSLIAALLTGIQAYPGKTVEISYTGTNNFTLLVNGKRQKKPYKF